MPELPEAEANRQRIADQCLNRTIEAAEPGDNVSYIDLPGDNERRRLVGHRFTQTHRHGKLVFAGSHSGPWICIHLGMSGSLHPYDEGEEPPDHTKFLIRFEGERRLAFRCPRKLGWLRVVDSPDAEIARIGFGPDALNIEKREFIDLLAGSNGALKSALIDQHKLAGIGNLWSDEILYRTGIMPDRKASGLDAKALSRVHMTMQAILTAVVETGATYAELPDDWLIHHRGKDKACPQCGGAITMKKVGGRSAYHCPDHQR